METATDPDSPPAGATTLKDGLRLRELGLNHGLSVLAPPVPGIVFTTAACGNLAIRGALGGALSRGDAVEAMDNRRRLSEALGIPPRWATARQVHGCSVFRDDLATVSATVGAAAPAVPEADAVVIREPGRPAAVLVADCLPIALRRAPGGLRGAGAIAVHAGWRGLCAGVIEAAVAAAREPGPTELSAWIGPSIGPCCFEVGPEVVDAFAAGRPTAPRCAERVGGSWYFDLRMAAAWVLAEAGVEVAGGLDVPCTRCDDRFFSHRRNATPRRQALVTWSEP